jgi:hypothetical protein
MPARFEPSAPRYRHTQSGAGMRVLLSLGPILLVTVGFLVGQSLLFLPLAIALGLAGVVFTSLTVEVTSTDLVWSFGPGIWRNAIPLSAIADATVETNKWWWGWGIHRTPHGWLYNVAGLKSVEVSTRDGRRVRIGSDEPDRLASVILAAMHG